MSAFDSNDPRDQALWKLLGRARRIKASPYFSRKVLRAIGNDASKHQWSGWQYLLRVFVPTLACVALIIMALTQLGQGNASSPIIANADLEFETIQTLDLLVSNYESSLWLDPLLPSSH